MLVTFENLIKRLEKLEEKVSQIQIHHLEVPALRAEQSSVQPSEDNQGKLCLHNNFSLEKWIGVCNDRVRNKVSKHF